MDTRDYFLTAIGLFIGTFILILIAGLFSMLGASAENIDWIYLTIPAALFSFTTGVGLVIAGILKTLVSQ